MASPTPTPSVLDAKMPEKVALIGSGNWGSAIATKMGVNAAACADFDDKVMM